uniref:Uncharacterized protein n=1 Tax=Denticeps clupeoides TaxID=299321 RepID=A0AAY4BL52_9TELE
AQAHLKLFFLAVWLFVCCGAWSFPPSGERSQLTVRNTMGQAWAIWPTNDTYIKYISCVEESSSIIYEFNSVHKINSIMHKSSLRRYHNMMHA